MSDSLLSNVFRHGSDGLMTYVYQSNSTEQVLGIFVLFCSHDLQRTPIPVVAWLVYQVHTLRMTLEQRLTSILAIQSRTSISLALAMILETICTSALVIVPISGKVVTLERIGGRGGSDLASTSENQREMRRRLRTSLEKR